mmetsp:Transcript_92061/g.183405  ORF Transcript_92061/g.183405 Transcript_92061/m.183405 type:complete len:125 (-) Transcript_92061:110-484(-)
MLTYVEIKGAVSSMYFNNVSGVHHKIQRSRFAVHYFQKAATECSNGNDESGSDSGNTGQERRGWRGKRPKRQQQERGSVVMARRRACPKRADRARGEGCVCRVLQRGASDGACGVQVQRRAGPV